MAEEVFEHADRQKLAPLYTGEGKVRVESQILLPEYKEEAARIIRVTCDAKQTRKTITLHGPSLTCEIEGVLAFHILYETSPKGEKGFVSSYLAKENFSHSFKIPGGETDLEAETVQALTEFSVKNIAVKLSGPRSLSARCDVVIGADIKANQRFSALEGQVGDDVILKGETMEVARLLGVFSEEMTFSETVKLPKAYLPIEEICEMDVRMVAQNVKSREGGIGFTALCDLHCSYRAQGEDTLISFYQPIEFDRLLGLEEASESAFPHVRLIPSALQASLDLNEEGENKVIPFELTFVCETSLLENTPCRLVEDAFSTKGELELEKEEASFCGLVGISDFSATVKDRIPLKAEGIERAEGICPSVEFENSYLEEGKLCLEGKVSFSYLGVGKEGEIRAYEDSVPFRLYPVELTLSVPESEDCTIEVYGAVRCLELDPDEDSLRLRFDLCGNVSVYRNGKKNHITAMTRGPEFAGEEGVLFVYPAPDEDLWHLAKEYHASPEKIRKENGLDDGPLPTYLKILR